MRRLTESPGFRCITSKVPLVIKCFRRRGNRLDGPNSGFIRFKVLRARTATLGRKLSPALSSGFPVRSMRSRTAQWPHGGPLQNTIRNSLNRNRESASTCEITGKSYRMFLHGKREDPGYRTVAVFRKRLLSGIEALFLDVLELAPTAGRLGIVAIDGAKLRATAVCLELGDPRSRAHPGRRDGQPGHSSNSSAIASAYLGFIPPPTTSLLTHPQRVRSPKRSHTRAYAKARSCGGHRGQYLHHGTGTHKPTSP